MFLDSVGKQGDDLEDSEEDQIPSDDGEIDNLLPDNRTSDEMTLGIKICFSLVLAPVMLEQILSHLEII